MHFVNTFFRHFYLSPTASLAPRFPSYFFLRFRRAALTLFSHKFDLYTVFGTSISGHNPPVVFHQQSGVESSSESRISLSFCLLLARSLVSSPVFCGNSGMTRSESLQEPELLFMDGQLLVQ